VFRKDLLALTCATLLAGGPLTALGHGCPGEMHKIDKALAAKPTLDAETLKKVRELRAEGERLHKENKHGESMLVLGSAKRLLKSN
jgi:hypothetical protein